MPSEGKDYDVFLSHNSADKLAVEVLARRLEDETATETLPPLKPFLDRWHLVPGNPWQEEIEQALDRSATCAVFIGPKGIGPWHNEEMRSALDERVGHPEFRVVPVLLPGATLPARGQLPRFLRRLTWVDFRSTLELNDDWAFQRLVAGIRGVPPGRDARGIPGVAITEYPYRGLEVFDESHTRFFFGREADTQHLIETLRSTRFLAVVGPSGSGKSSLVRAGLLTQLRLGSLPLSEQWRYSVFKPGAHPLEELAVSLAQLTGHSDVQSFLKSLEADERELHLQTRLLLRGQPEGAHLCVVIDQLEELFTLCQDRTERQCFINALRYAATVVGGQTVVVVTMRADFITRAAENGALGELLSGHQFIVSPLEDEDLLRVVEEPARLVGARLEDGLAKQMLHDTGQEPGALPLLEHALLQLWEQRRSDNVLTFAAYADIGGVQGALAKQAELVFGRFSAEQQRLARQVLLRLTQPGEGTEDTRRRATLAELQTLEGEQDAIETVVKTLTDARLLVTTRDQQADVVDVVHEALIRGWPRLRGWIQENPDALRMHRRITEGAQEWARLGRDEGILFRGGLLSIAQKWREQHGGNLNDLEKEFLDKSIELTVKDEKKEKTRQLQEEQYLWFQWILASTIGLVVGEALNGVVTGAITTPVNRALTGAVFEAVTRAASGFWNMAIVGAVTGFGQWFVLKHQIGRSGWWILATTGGMAVGGAVNKALAGSVFQAMNKVASWSMSMAIVGAVTESMGETILWAMGGAVSEAVSMALVGAVTGFGQWFVLKHQIGRSGWWILATTGGMAVGGAVGGAVVGAVTDAVGGIAVAGVLGALGVAAGGALYGTITGQVLIWLMRRPIVKQ